MSEERKVLETLLPFIQYASNGGEISNTQWKVFAEKIEGVLPQKSTVKKFLGVDFVVDPALGKDECRMISFKTDAAGRTTILDTVNVKNLKVPDAHIKMD